MLGGIYIRTKQSLGLIYIRLMQKSVRKIHLKSFENPIKNSILQKQCMKNPSHIISKTQQNKSLFKTVSPKSHPKASENN